ncbi:hypothetical protein A4G20_01460 [Pasteurellaceae bacterium RH1A]|nr:hypothetical protein A4G20_01460 [Pasteurellaceae bacterium RH1A]
MINPCLFIALAHLEEPVPKRFWDYAKPPQIQPNARQVQKWQARRMAFYLLHLLFEKASLDSRLLDHIQRTASGRPYLEAEEIDFNISHSGDYVAVILSVGRPKKAVGIDLEHPQKTRRFRDLLNHYANPEELAYAERVENLSDYFYLSWCLREAVLKSQGVGIVKLSEVRHLPEAQKIFSAHCPQGQLDFVKLGPCYLSYFYQTSEGLVPQTFQLKQAVLQKIHLPDPLVYHVNKEAYAQT